MKIQYAVSGELRNGTVYGSAPISKIRARMLLKRNAQRVLADIWNRGCRKWEINQNSAAELPHGFDYSAIFVTAHVTH